MANQQNEAFVARQPIFDRKQKVFAYELLFRFGLDNFFDHLDGDQASSKVIVDSFLLFGIERMTKGKKAFINFTHDLLIANYASFLPNQSLVVEVLEDVEPDEEVQAACQKLKQAGYLLALDDFVDREDYASLLSLADIIKVDFMATNALERKRLVDQYRPSGIKMLAEKVETRDVFDQALEMGYSYFQGFFFSKPVIISGRDIPAFKLNYLRILKEVNQPEFNFNEIESIIKTEVSLSYKLLRYLNSAFFGFRTKITSIKQALTLLGQDEIRKWIGLTALAGMGEDKPEELVRIAIIRARFCESIAPKVGLGGQRSNLFLLGIFSVIDAILDRPLGDILDEISLSEDVKQALLGEKNQLRGIYDLVLAYEKGEWEAMARLSAGFRLDEAVPPTLYLDSVGWSDQIFGGGP